MNKQAISRILETARRSLVDTGTRNRLVHVNRANQRANCLNIINERSDDIFEILRIKAQKMRFKAMGTDQSSDAEEILLAASDESLQAMEERYIDKFLETPLGPEALARRLLRIANNAKTAEEEQGLNILYLTLGFLRWREQPNSSMVREAPIVLLPVELVRNPRTSNYNIRAREDDLSANLPLQERLRQDFGIALPNIDETEEWRPSHYFTLIQEAISGQPSWSIDTDGMQLGFFSFAKLLMLHDLNPASWPDDTLTTNSILAGLLHKGFESDAPMFGANDKLDKLLDPAEIIQVVDADASQTKVIEEVRKGSSLVVQGPPGTGKSQTITNIIAAAAHDNKSVLFIAEKMAALSVVHNRLVKTNLRDICLELHSRTANKKAFTQELARTLESSTQFPLPVCDTENLKSTRDELNRLDDLLHRPMPENGDSPFQTISEIVGFIAKETNAPSIASDELETLSQTERDSVCKSIATFTEAFVNSGPRYQHPYRGTTNLHLQPTDIERLKSELSQAKDIISAIQREHEAINRETPLLPLHSLADIILLANIMTDLAAAPAAAIKHIPVLYERTDIARIKEALQTVRDWYVTERNAQETFAFPAWHADLSTMRTNIARGRSSWFARWFSPYRQACLDFATLLTAPLPKTPQQRLQLVDDLLHLQEQKQQFQKVETWLQSVLGDLWQGEQTPFTDLLQTCEWCVTIRERGVLQTNQEILTALQKFSNPAETTDSLRTAAQKVLQKTAKPLHRLGIDPQTIGLGDNLETAPLVDMQQIFERMSADVDGYKNWVTLENAIADMRTNKAAPVAEAVLDNRLHPSDAKDEFLYACAEARWQAVRSTHPQIVVLEHCDRHELTKTFHELERTRLQDVQNLILNRHRQQIPRGSTGEMGIIRGEIGRKRGHKPIRWMMKNAATMLQRIKPVMLMSPLSVAQFLPPASLTFDLLVIDEASQVRPEDALGAIVRAKQIVVIGDQKQLPPTSFFDRLVDDTEDNEDENETEEMLGAAATDMESILSLCEARGMRQRMLEWHYRSRDPSLIRVSNEKFYGNSLILPPSPLAHDENYGLKFRRIEGFYTRGGKRTNRPEAQAVVKAVAQHAQEWPTYSLGVVAFSKTQADLLREILEYERRQDETLNDFLSQQHKEETFVKNIENVQGDERDVIFISIGYGPQEANGRMTSMNFGPINKEGGERRLNVLFSRARARCEVFASFDPEDMDIHRLKSEGPRILKTFLDFAKTGILDERNSPEGATADSPFEEDVTDVIRSFGYEADPQVGSAGFRIDIGVRHPHRPGQYIVAVECDGATYHSALWARERDRLRQEILENLGWRFHRIWSTDWFHNRNHEKERLHTALENARRAAQNGISIRGANETDNESNNSPNGALDTTAEQTNPREHSKVTAPFTYQCSDLSGSTTLQNLLHLEPHEVPLPQLAELVRQTIQDEGPIHNEVLARRISAAFGKNRTGRRIAESVQQASAMLTRQNHDLLQIGAFLLTSAQNATPPVRDRSNADKNILKAEYLPPMEIRAARDIIHRENGDMTDAEAIRAIAQLFGFKRVGKDLHDTIAAAIKSHHHPA